MLVGLVMLPPVRVATPVGALVVVALVAAVLVAGEPALRVSLRWRGLPCLGRPRWLRVARLRV